MKRRRRERNRQKEIDEWKRKGKNKTHEWLSQRNTEKRGVYPRGVKGLQSKEEEREKDNAIESFVCIKKVEGGFSLSVSLSLWFLLRVNQKSNCLNDPLSLFSLSSLTLHERPGASFSLTLKVPWILHPVLETFPGFSLSLSSLLKVKHSDTWTDSGSNKRKSTHRDTDEEGIERSGKNFYSSFHFISSLFSLLLTKRKNPGKPDRVKRDDKRDGKETTITSGILSTKQTSRKFLKNQTILSFILLYD